MAAPINLQTRDSQQVGTIEVPMAKAHANRNGNKGGGRCETLSQGRHQGQTGGRCQLSGGKSFRMLERNSMTARQFQHSGSRNRQDTMGCRH